MCTKCNQKHTSCGCRAFTASTCGQCRPILIVPRSTERESERNNRETEVRKEKRKRGERENTQRRHKCGCRRRCRPVLIAPERSEDCGCRDHTYDGSCCRGDY